MNIVKYKKKEKYSTRYYLMKELMRDKVTIKREQNGFQIIIPKSYKYGKVNLDKLQGNEFSENYNVFRVNFKDILRLIRE